MRIQDHDPNYCYEMIPAWPNGYPAGIRFFQHFPGIYCKGCGKLFALYSYSIEQPHGLDENHKPYCNHCFACYETDEQHEAREQATKNLQEEGARLYGV